MVFFTHAHGVWCCPLTAPPLDNRPNTYLQSLHVVRASFPVWWRNIGGGFRIAEIFVWQLEALKANFPVCKVKAALALLTQTWKSRTSLLLHSVNYQPIMNQHRVGRGHMEWELLLQPSRKPNVSQLVTSISQQSYEITFRFKELFLMFLK